MRNLLYSLMACLLCALGAQAEIKIAVLHPLLSEMAQTIGGEHVEVAELFPANAELHSFTPSPADIAAGSGAHLLLACGKGVEPYLADLKQSLSAQTRVVELGASIPDVNLPGSKKADPHWWNTPQNMKRASRALLRELCTLMPEAAADLRAGQKKYAADMDALEREARLAFNRIPKEQRVLVTAHAAMCHFCAAFGFTPVAVHGIAHESEGDTATLAHLLAELRQHKAACLFTEAISSPRAIQSLAEQVGATTRPLIPDGIHPQLHSYREIFSFNIRNIAEGLTPAP